MEPYLTQDASTTMAYLYTLLVSCRTLESRNIVRYRFQSTDASHRALYFEGNVVSLSSFGEFVRDSLRERQLFLDTYVLHGLTPDTPELYIPKPEDFSKIVDDPQNVTIGYNFVTEPKNDLQKYGDILFKRMLSHPEYKDSYSYVRDGKLELRTAAVYQWLDHAAESRDKFFSIIHLSSGQPRRAEEDAALALRNLPCGTRRGVEFEHGETTLITAYSKTSAVSLRTFSRDPPC